MRTIKFRGRSLDGKEWYHGDLEYNRVDNIARIHTYDKDGYYIRQYYVNPDTVCQFTGLQDKNGKDIYEGDIMYSEFSDGYGGYSLIGWNEREASFGMMDAYSYQSKQEGYDFPEFKNYVLIAHLQKALICEVVGNIYDNPELLTKTK